VEDKPKRRRLEKEAALEQMRSFCAYQERCHKEVRTRLLEYQVYGDTLEEIMSELIGEGFLNEERFARSYARGKFRIKKWGKNKIRQELKFRQVSDYCIRKGMTEIDEEEYYKVLQEILEKKSNLLREKDYYKIRKKLTDHATRKGFEYNLISEVLNNIVKK